MDGQGLIPNKGSVFLFCHLIQTGCWDLRDPVKYVLEDSFYGSKTAGA
jgi:hypothetical protein